MASNQLMILVFVAAIAFISAFAEAQSSVGIVHVNGTLYCTANGAPAAANANATPVFPGAAVQVDCSGTDVIANSPSNDTTTATGMYRVFLIPRPNATVDSIISSCRIFVLTPLSSCNPTLPSTGLVSSLSFVRTTFISFLRLTYMVPAGFTSQA